VILDCVTWTIQDDYGGFGDRSSAATTVDECRAECSNTGGCTAIDWVAGLSPRSQCWLVGFWTTWSGDRPGIQRHTMSNRCGQYKCWNWTWNWTLHRPLSCRWNAKSGYFFGLVWLCALTSWPPRSTVHAPEKIYANLCWNRFVFKTTFTSC